MAVTGRAGATTAIVIAALLWGTTGTVASFIPDAVSPLAIGAATMGVGGALLFATAARPALRVIRDAASRRWVLWGALGVIVYPLAFYSGMDLAGVAIGNVVALGAGPIVTALFEWLFERHRLTVRWSIATVLALAGMMLLTFGAHPGSGDGADTGAGVALGALAGLAYGLYTYSSSRAIRAGHGSRAVMGAMFGLGAAGLLPVLVVTGAPVLAEPESLGLLIYLAFGPMFVAYLLVGVALRTLRSSSVTTIALLEPVAATVLAVLVVGERLDLTAWLGLGAILIGIIVLVSARPASLDTRVRLDFRA